MSREVPMTIKGQKYTISAEQVREVARKHDPKNIRDFYVEVEGTRFSPKQLIHLVTQARYQSFNSQNARSVLAKLGFKVDVYGD